MRTVILRHAPCAPASAHSLADGTPDVDRPFPTPAACGANHTNRRLCGCAVRRAPAACAHPK
eukprot:355552-Chlamydomonas_euryale.AAC.6